MVQYINFLTLVMTATLLVFLIPTIIQYIRGKTELSKAYIASSLIILASFVLLTALDSLLELLK